MHERIEAEFSGPLGQILAESPFGSRNAAQVYDELRAFCEQELGAAPTEVRFFRMSVGAVFGLALRDGRGVIVKLHLPREPLERLRSVQWVQRELAGAGFPCPRPVGEAGLVLELPTTTEELLDGGEERDAHDPRVRRIMAQTLSELIRLTSSMKRRTRSQAAGPWRLRKAFGPSRATRFSTSRRPRLARNGSTGSPRLRARVPPSRLVAGHADWVAKHFRFRGDEVHVIYDWDSLRLEPEPQLVAGAAVHFPYTEAFPVPRVASLDELRAFVEEYEHERPTPFAREERSAVWAYAVYALAYTARCEHARDPSGSRPADSYRDALARFGEELLA